MFFLQSVNQCRKLSFLGYRVIKKVLGVTLHEQMA